METDYEVLEKIKIVKKFISQMEKSFEDAKTCRKCNESCGDIFYNNYGKSVDAIEFIENKITEIFEQSTNTNHLEQLEPVEDDEIEENEEVFELISEEFFEEEPQSVKIMAYKPFI